MALLRVLAASAADAFIVTDLDARIEVWNPAAEQLYGIPAADALGQDIYPLTEATIVGEVDVPNWLPREIALATGAWHGRVIERPKVGRSVGREVVVETALSRVVDEQGQVRGILSIKRDITASYRLERELAALGSLATATGAARTRAEIAQSAIDVLCAATSASSGLIIDVAGEVARLEAAHGLDPEVALRAAELTRIGAPLLEAVAPLGRVVVGDLDDLPMRSDARAWLATLGVRSIAAVGIHRGEAARRPAGDGLDGRRIDASLVGDPPPGERPRRARARERPAARGDHPSGGRRAGAAPPSRRARRAHPDRPDGGHRRGAGRTIRPPRRRGPRGERDRATGS